MKKAIAKSKLAQLGLLTGLGILVNAGVVARGQVVHEPIVGLPCEGCQAVFEGMPRSLDSESRIAAADEPGQAMRIEGTVRDRHGKPAAGVIIYAYHTNERGIYPAPAESSNYVAARHGRLRAWAKTDDQGRYRFDSIRPGGYPATDVPQHVHMHVLEIGRCTYYIDDILFADDPRLTPEKQHQLTRGRGGPGVTMPRKDAEGVWIVARDIVLGEKIPGYPAADVRQEPPPRGVPSK